MHRIALAVLLVAAEALPAQSPPGDARGTPFETRFTQLQWVSPVPNDSSAQFAQLRADSATGATQLLWRFRPGAQGPCEWHASSQSLVVIRGSLTLHRAGIDGTTLGVGDYAYLPKNTRFRLVIGPEPTLVLSILDGKPAMHPVSGAECRK